ncbi:MAG: NrfD/PsrC family molybdoenzyme membrane anchor subunit [Pseudonocardiaceae bacterium]
MSDGLRGANDGQGNRQRAQTNGRRGGRRRRQGNGAPTVPAAEFTSYYNLPVINKPVLASPDIPVYLFLGGLAGAASLLGAGAQATGRSALGRVSKAGAFSAGVLSLVGLVHNLGRPSRFLNMLRVFKVTSPMNVGSWILAGYVPLAGVAATGDGGVRCRHRTSCLRRMEHRVGMTAEPYYQGRGGGYVAPATSCRESASSGHCSAGATECSAGYPARR